MKNYQIILIVFVVASVVMVTVVPMLRKKIYNSLLVQLRNKDFQKLYETLDKPTTVFLLPKAQSLYIRLQGALAEKSDQVDAILDALIPLVKDTKAKDELTMRGFNYYVDKSDKEIAKKYLDLVNNTSNDNMKKEANRVYHIYIDKSDEDLEDLLKELETMPDIQKGVPEYLISIIYKNKHDSKNQEKYEKLSRQHMNLLNEQFLQQTKK